MDSNMSEYEKKISELRSRLKKVKSSNSRKSRDIEAISTEIERLENEVYTNTTSDSFDQELEQVEALIAKNQMIYKENSNKLLEIHNEMLDISASENLGNFSVEDFAKNDDERKKKYEKLSGLYDSYGRVKRDTLERKKTLAALVRKRNKLKKDMELSDSLHIGASQYREITDTLRKRKIVISILEQDSYLASIIKKPYKEQTPDERKAIKAAKEEIIKKISEEIQRGATISESIEILYSLDTEMILKKKPREVKMNLEELKNIVNSSDGAVVRFVGYQEKKEPLKAPDDMLLSSQGEIIDKAMNSVYTYSKNYHVLKGKDDTKGYTGEESKEFIDSIRGTLPGVNEQEIRALANRYAMAYHDYRDMVSNARNYTGEDIGAANDKVESARIEIENYIKNYYQEAKANQGKDDKDGQKDFSDMTKEELEKEIEKLEDQIAMGRTQGIDVTDLEEQLKLATSEFDKKDINPNLSNPNPDFDFSEMDIDDLRNSRGNIHNQLMIGQAQGKDISDLAEQLNAIDSEIARREKGKQKTLNPTTPNPGNPDFDFSEMDIDDLRNSRGNIHNQLMIGQAQGKDISDLAEQLNAIDTEIARREKEDQKTAAPKPGYPDFDISEMDLDDLKNYRGNIHNLLMIGQAQEKDISDLAERLNAIDNEIARREKEDQKTAAPKPGYPDFDISEMDLDDLKNYRGNIHNLLMIGQAQEKDISDLAERLNAIDNEIARREKEEQMATQPTVAPTTASHTTAPNTASHTTAPNTASHTTAPNTASHTTAPNTASHTTAPNTASHTTAPNTASHTTAPKKTTKPTVYSVQSILAKLTKDLDVGKKDVKRYNASNIKVRNTFKEELHSGNVLYNVVHVVPTIFKTTVGFFRKLGAKIMLKDDAKKMVETLKSRINDLSEDELQFLFDNYRGNAIVQDMNLQINDLLQAKLKEFGLAKVEKLNDDIKKNYSELFTLVGQINALDNKTDKASIAKKQELYAKASVFVKKILDSRKDANSLLSGGIHGQEEDFKAAATKMNYVGLRFSKIDDFDSELQQRLGETELRMNQAIAADEPKATVDKFLELEALYSKNTEVKKSIVGRRSVGAKCYSPLAEELNYKDDPFIKDLFTTIAVTSATVSAFRALSAQKMINEHNQQLSQANSNNQATIDYVHQTGNDIASRRETFAEGMKAQGYGDTLGTANLGERYSLDGSNWHLGSDTYRSLDSHFHQISSDNFANVSSQLNDVVSKYGQGTITNAQALQEIAKISSSSNNAFMNLVTQSKEVLSNYTASHPQFDLSAVQGSIDYLVNHTDAIANMNQSMVDVTNLGGGLADVTLQQLEPLTAMPGLYSSLIAAASSAALASGVSKSMRKKDREKYAEELSQMIMEGYGQELEENEKGHYL